MLENSELKADKNRNFHILSCEDSQLAAALAWRVARGQTAEDLALKEAAARGSDFETVTRRLIILARRFEAARAKTAPANTSEAIRLPPVPGLRKR